MVALACTSAKMVMLLSCQTLQDVIMETGQARPTQTCQRPNVSLCIVDSQDPLKMERYKSTRIQKKRNI